MNGARRTLVASLVILAAAGCAPKTAPVDTTKDVEALKAAQDRELVAVGSGNVDTAVTPYADDIVMMAPDQPVINGKAALRTWFESFYKENSAAGTYTSADVAVAGDWAVVRYTGELTMTPTAKGGKPMTEHIKGLHIYKKQADGRWLIAQDVWNNDGPPPPPPPPAKK